jgi:WD40 repeat protein
MDLREQPNHHNELLFVGFNQDNACFACGTKNGFRIYNCDPFKETFCREFACDGIWRVEMLFRCNILALVGNGSNTRFQENKVVIWDDHQSRCIGELSFKSPVRSVKLRRDRIVVVLSEKVFIYNFADLKLIEHYETSPNPNGICALCPHNSSNVLACPGIQQGYIRIELFDRKKNQSHMIAAHSGNISFIALNSDGTIVASSSEKGTTIKLFDTQTGNALREFKRGSSEARIQCLAFSPQSDFLAVSSSKGTIHIFQIKSLSESDGGSSVHEDELKSAPVSSVLSTTKNLVKKLPGSKYFASEASTSILKYRVADEVKHVVAFGVSDKNVLFVVGSDGTFHKLLFDGEKGSELVVAEKCKFVKEGPEDGP